MDLYGNAILSGGTMFAGVGERMTPLSSSSRVLLASAWISTAMLSCLEAPPCLLTFASARHHLPALREVRY